MKTYPAAAVESLIQLANGLLLVAESRVDELAKSRHPNDRELVFSEMIVENYKRGIDILRSAAIEPPQAPADAPLEVPALDPLSDEAIVASDARLLSILNLIESFAAKPGASTPGTLPNAMLARHRSRLAKGIEERRKQLLAARETPAIDEHSKTG